MRLGIFGGTFNPIHVGHLINAEIIKNNYSLDKVIFIPSKLPVHKELACMTSAEDRFNMVKLAISGQERFDVSPVEIDRDIPSYTIDTLRDLLKLYPGSNLFLIIGADSFNEIDTWKDFEEILEIVTLIVMRRHTDIVYRDEILKSSKKIFFAQNPMIEISSSYIRERLRNNQCVKFQIPDSVSKYINNKGLYRN